MTPTDIKRLQKRTALYLSEEVAAVAGLDLDQLKQFSLGKIYAIPDQQLIALARRMGLDLQGESQ